MGIFDRFRRNRTDASVLPAEVSEYYETEQRDRRGVAVLLGIITLVITLLIASALFFGGRAVYRSATKKDKITSQTASKTEKQGAAPAVPNGSSTGGNGSDSAKPTPPSQATPAPAPTSAPSNGTMPSTGDQPPAATTLPRTGDDGM